MQSDMTHTTIDKLLGGRFEIEQPAKGYRIAVDTLLLAAALQAQAGQHVLDMGCGVGGVMLALATRVQEVHITGIEIQAHMADLCVSNIRRNGHEPRLKLLRGDVTVLDEALRAAFDHVAMNPPYTDAARHSPPPNASKKRAHVDEDGEMGAWITAAAAALKEGGVMTMINRSDRQSELLALCQEHFNHIRIKPIWSKADGTCKRIILRAKKGQGSPETIEEPPFLLYGPDGRYTPQAEALLRHAGAMG